MKNLTERGKICYFIIGVLLILEIVGLFYNSGIVAGINERADKLKVYAIASKDDATILAGNIYDRNGMLLVETYYETEGKKKTVYSNGKAYSQILGYTGSRSLNPTADSVEEVVGDRLDYRLMDFLDEDYWGKNGLYAISDLDSTKGQNISLTIDDNIQMYVYQVLASQMSESSEQGSAVVMNAKTGEILAIVSFPAYDFNNLTTAKAQMLADEKETELEPGYPVSYKNPQAPGSILKILTAVSLIDHEMENFTVADTPFSVNGWQCNNAYVSEGDTIGYADALKRSSNVFFAQAALALGKEKFRETAEKFMLIEDVFMDEDGDGEDDGNTEYISLDFGYVPYNWNLEVADDVFAQTGFGQGKAELTTVHAAMVVQAIANDGIMMKPYLINKLTNEDGKAVYTGTAEVLSRATSKSTANKVTKAMLESAKYMSIHYKGIGNTAQVFKNYQVAGKTGTAENGDQKDTVNAWFISFAPADAPEYVVIVNQCKTKKAGYKMMEPAAEIYQYLFEEYPQLGEIAQ